MGKPMHEGEAYTREGLYTLGKVFTQGQAKAAGDWAAHRGRKGC